MRTPLLGSKVFTADNSNEHHNYGNLKNCAISKQLKKLQDEAFMSKSRNLCLAQYNAVLTVNKTSMPECQLSVLNMQTAVETMSKIVIFI